MVILYIKCYILSQLIALSEKMNQCLGAYKNALNDIDSVKRWGKAVEALTQTIEVKQYHIDNMQDEQRDIHTLEMRIRLYQIFRLIVKLKSYYQAFAQKAAVKTCTQMRDVCEQSYHTIVRLNQRLSEISYSQVQNEAQNLLLLIQLLECQSRLLSDINRQMFEKDSSPMPQERYAKNVLWQKADEIVDKQSKELVDEIIFGYDILAKCYVVSRKSTINESLQAIKENIEVLINMFLQDDTQQDKILQHVASLFQQLECLLFSSNCRQSHCSKVLFDKTKKVRKSLLRACAKHPITANYITTCH